MFAEFRTETMFSRPLKRAISALVLFFFTFTLYSPAVYAAWHEVSTKQAPARNTLFYINPMGDILQKLSDQVSAIEQEAESGNSSVSGERLATIHQLTEQLRQEDINVRNELVSEQNRLKQSGVSQNVVARHQSFEQNYTHNITGLLDTLGQLDPGLDTQALSSVFQEIHEYLRHPVQNSRQSFSNDLDFVTPPPRRLHTTQAAIERLLGVSGQPAWSLTAYLETDSATATADSLRALVADHGGDPLALYQWVRNTIRFIPSYGVMQGAAYTIQSEQGNAFDTASVLIALYREAGIPARYAYGTVSLPAESVQNWVGGVSNINAATNILSQGGIPQQQISYGGASEEVELEHIWVEAWINGEWVALDPAFKQYIYTEGLDLASQVPLDADQFLSQLQSSATINEAEGWVQGLDARQVQAQLDNYQARVETYLNSQHASATLGDVLGKQQIIPDQSVSLEDVQLPYNNVRASAVVPNLPESLYYKFRLQVGNATGGSFGMPVQWGGVVAELERKTTQLVGKSLAVSFRPATAADQQTLESYLPENPQSIEDLPAQLPANTIRMIGEITVDGEVIAFTPTVTLGQSLMTRLGFAAPERSWRYSENNLVAGKYQAVAIDMQGISPDQLENLKSRVETVSAMLAAEDYAGLTKHDLVGSVLQAGIQGYLAETYAMDRIAAAASDIVYNRSPSYGTFSTEMNVSYLFGMPRNVFFSGVVMDVDQISSNTESVDNCYEDWVAFNRSSGMRSSAYEHLIPERLFATEEEPAEGVSTAKALALAMAQGQRIYTLTQDNTHNLSQITIDSEARSEIQSALQRGYEVTVHELPLNVNGWEGSGYAIIDPENGVGAYKISGGVSGGFLSDEAASLLTVIGIGLGVIGLFAMPGLFMLLSGVISLALAVNGYLEFASNLEGTNCANSGAAELYVSLVIGAAVLGLVFGGFAAFALLSWVGFYAAGAISGAFIKNKTCV